VGIQRFSRNPRSNDGVVDPLQLFGNLAQTSYYQVDFSSLTTFSTTNGDLTLLKFLEDRGIDKDFISKSSGLLCSEASLPATSLATGEVKDNFMGISQEFAHTRLYTDFDFTFYIDSDYKNLKFFESWIEYISGGNMKDLPVPTQSNYYRRMRYPDSYKCQTITITKFERNLNSGNTLKYSFINAFPKTISAVPVSYGNSDILKVNVSFNYDRYVVNATSGFSKAEQGEFKDAVQQSAELQQRFDSREQSLAPAQTLRDNTGNRDPNGGDPPAPTPPKPKPPAPKTTTYKYDTTKPVPANMYGLKSGEEVSFQSRTGQTFFARNTNGNMQILQKGFNAFGIDNREIIVDMARFKDSKGNLANNHWLFEDLYNAAQYSIK
jgi:hypothetical protein